MIPGLLRNQTRLLLRVPPIRKAVETLGIRRWYERRAILQNLREPTISADACYDAERGLLTLHGSWRKIGAKLAQVTPVLRSAEDARDYRASVVQAERSILDVLIDEAIEYLRAMHADVAALIEGSADVLEGVELKDVILANVWPSLVLWREYARSCAALVVQSHSGTILGQNLDLGPSNNVAVAHISPDDGPARICHLVPGSLWLGMGVNEFGLTFGGGSVNVARDFEPSAARLPTMFSDMAVLGSARSVAEAEQLFQSFAPFGPTHNGISLVMTDRQGAVSRLEAAGPDVSVRECQGSLGLAANHFELENMSKLNRNENSHDQMLLDNSMERVARAHHGFAKPTQANAKMVCQFLRKNRGTGAWRRTAAYPDTGWTTASYVVDLGESRFHYCLGTRPPASAGWRELDLEPLFSRSS